jgi:transposase-like protein
LTKVVRWIGIEVSNLPTFDGLNHLGTFIVEFERNVPVQKRMLALDKALKETLARWWGTHKKNIVEWVQCRTLLTVRISNQAKGCKVRYTCQSCPKNHVRSCEEAWRNIPKEWWVHKFINTLDNTPINWYLQVELCIATSDWNGMTQKFIATFLFESQYPTIY